MSLFIAGCHPRSKVRADLNTLNAIIQAFVAAGDMVNVRYYYEEIKDIGLIPDASTFAIILLHLGMCDRDR